MREESPATARKSIPSEQQLPVNIPHPPSTTQPLYDHFGHLSGKYALAGRTEIKPIFVRQQARTPEAAFTELTPRFNHHHFVTEAHLEDRVRTEGPPAGTVVPAFQFYTD